MDAIRFLLGYMIRIVIVLFFVVIVWWLVSTLFPKIKVGSLFSLNGTSTVQGSWLPAPGSFKGLLGNASVPDGKSNVYTPGKAYNGYGNAYNGNQGGANVDFVTYTTEGEQIIRNQNNAVFNSNEQFKVSQNGGTSAQKNLYIRNLSIYEGGHAYTGLSFVGEARNTMFQNGKFPIIIINNRGQVVSVSYAEATSNWSIPGWIRFQVKINDVLPDKVPCTMVFEEARGTYTYQTNPPVRIAIPVMCN